MKKITIATIAAAVLGLAVWLALPEDGEKPRAAESASSADATVPADATARRFSQADASPRRRDEPPESREPDAAEEPSKTPEEQKAEAEEAAVEAFDNLTDKWMEPSGKGVTMADVDTFVREFKKVPKARREECLQRALNLVPDENVMLLAGILMDKSQPKECAELVFNDVLNRDEDVKKPILRQIYADKTHPCWTDTAWILDVTGEKSAGSGGAPL